MHTPISAGTVNGDVFHDASSRPPSLAADAADTQHGASTSEASKNAFDEFDDFGELAEADEAGDFDFGFGHSRDPSDFDAVFDSSAHPTTTATTTVGSGPYGATFSGRPAPATNSPFATNTANSSIQHTPEAKHDWDAIFSGLDNSNTGNIDASHGSSDPWETSSALPKAGGFESSQASKAKDIGRAISPGTDHDDPILKRLTGMGYARGDALNALEKYDYDINAVSHKLSPVNM